MPLSRKEQPRYLIIMAVDMRKCLFAPNIGVQSDRLRRGYADFLEPAIVSVFEGHVARARRRLTPGVGPLIFIHH